MVVDESPCKLGCEACGRAMAKATKVHKGKRYCATCYPRLFKRRMCTGCGNFARLPVFDLAAHCSACERSAPCFRCEKTDYKIGMRTAYGPVCKTCAHHFHAIEPCEVCGTPSQRLARNTATGLRVCPKCATSSATCPSCRRHRVLVSGEDGISRCRACTNEVTRMCEKCGSEMPAGRGRECEACSWTKVFEKRLAINLHGFSSDHFEQLFSRFGQWLFERLGPSKAALKINSFYRFFRSIETRWGCIPSYDDMLKHFTAIGLRRAETPMRWLSEVGAISVNAEDREKRTEERRLRAILAEIEDPWSQQLLMGYFTELTARRESGETDLRSIRLALRPAANMLKGARLAAGTLPNQKTLELFWRSSPGHVAALSGFVGHLNKSHELQLKWRPSDHWLEKAKKNKAERELVALLREDQQASDFEVRWIVKGLAYFHDIRKVSRKTLVYRKESYQGVEGFSVERASEKLWVPSVSSYDRGGHQVE